MPGKPSMCDNFLFIVNSMRVQALKVSILWQKTIDAKNSFTILFTKLFKALLSDIYKLFFITLVSKSILAFLKGVKI